MYPRFLSFLMLSFVAVALFSINCYAGRIAVTVSDYCRFLNAVADQEDPYILYNRKMGEGETATIIRRYNEGRYTYTAVEGKGDAPVNYVMPKNLICLCNWYQNGQQTGKLGRESIESGAYTISASGELMKNPDATFYLADDSDLFSLENGDLSSSQKSLNISSKEIKRTLTLSSGDSVSEKEEQGEEDITSDENKYVNAVICIEAAISGGDDPLSRIDKSDGLQGVHPTRNSVQPRPSVLPKDRTDNEADIFSAFSVGDDKVEKLETSTQEVSKYRQFSCLSEGSYSQESMRPKQDARSSSASVYAKKEQVGQPLTSYETAFQEAEKYDWRQQQWSGEGHFIKWRWNELAGAMEEVAASLLRSKLNASLVQESISKIKILNKSLEDKMSEGSQGNWTLRIKRKFSKNRAILPERTALNELQQFHEELRKSENLRREKNLARIDTAEKKAMEAQKDLQTKAKECNESKWADQRLNHSLQETLQAASAAYNRWNAEALVAVLDAETDSMIAHALRGNQLYQTIGDIPVIEQNHRQAFSEGYRGFSDWVNSHESRGFNRSNAVVEAEHALANLKNQVQRYPLAIQALFTNLHETKPLADDSLKSKTSAKELSPFQKSMTLRSEEDASFRTYQKILDRYGK